MKERIKKKGYSTAYRALTDESHFQFATKAKPNALTQYDTAQNATYTHTTYCDGKTPAEEMVQKAIELGLSELGFSIVKEKTYKTNKPVFIEKEA